MSTSAERLIGLLPPRRLAPYLRRSDHDPARALDYYRWSHAMASECWTVIAHFEVLLRHRVDAVMAEHAREEHVKIPWFFHTALLPPGTHEPLRAQLDRLSQEGRLDRDQVIAVMTFGFWKSFFASDELWRASLHRVFTHRAGLQRKDVTARLETSSAGKDVYSESPHQPTDTVVVAARDAWPLYAALCDPAAQAPPAYVCQPGRFFKPVDRLGFYSDQMIHRELPQVLHRVDNIEWTLQNAGVLSGSEDRLDRKVAALIEWSAGPGARFFDFEDPGTPTGRFQVFLLSSPGDPRHKTLPADIPHHARGRGSALTQRQRCVSSHSLDTAESTNALTDA